MVDKTPLALNNDEYMAKKKKISVNYHVAIYVIYFYVCLTKQHSFSLNAHKLTLIASDTS